MADESSVDPRLRAALRRQLGDWRRTLEAGAQRVGWKLGVGQEEQIGEGQVVGHLTTATMLKPGGIFDARGIRELRADAEVAVLLRRDIDAGSSVEDVVAAIGGFGPAVELCDLGGTDDPEEIVSANVFHRALALGSLEHPTLPSAAEGGLVINGELRGSDYVADDIAGLLLGAATTLAAVGERLRAGDRVITGAVVQLPVAPGDEVVADLGPLGTVGVAIGP